MFTEVLVEEVISDVSFYTQEKMREIVPTISNKRYFCDEPPDQPVDTKDNTYYLRAPRNSIIGRAKATDIDSTLGAADSLTVYYPFFSSHFVLPVKPGEVVWTFTQNNVSYWVTRVHAPIHVEDLNFSHADRSHAAPLMTPPALTPEGQIPEVKTDKLDVERVPNFPDGNSFDNRFTDKRDQTEDDIKTFKPAKRTYRRTEEDIPGNTHYEVIFANNNEKDSIVYEPVPTLTKRPGDLVLQGSNNAAIILGTDRGYTKATRPIPTKTNAMEAPAERAGSIDLVAGRGRFLENTLTSGMDSLDQQPQTDGTTQPRVIKNIREQFERDKNLGLIVDNPGVHLENVPEGDPDFKDDAARIYISMKTNPDDMLDLTGNMPQTVSASDTANAGTDVAAVANAGAVILKSDEVRIVARQEVGTGTTIAPAVNGSIKIVKEGVADSRDGNGRAAIMIQPDGTIIIDGPKIVIGSGAKATEDGNGEGSQISLGLAATEPMVLGDLLKAKLEALIDAINAITVPTGTGPSGTPINSGTFTSIKGELNQILSKIGKTL